MTRPFLTHCRQVKLLASIRSPDEASIAVRGGADIVDAKEPSRGALGEVEPLTLKKIRDVVPRSIALSATTGDIAANQSVAIADACRRVADSGADWVKIGFFGSGGAASLLDRLAGCEAAHGRRIAVFMADQDPDLEIIEDLAGAGFAGVMLDTAVKGGLALTDYMSDDALAAFIARARANRLLTGLAGSLRLRHIHHLMRLAPDVLGFRGALCPQGQRTDNIEAEQVGLVREAMTAAQAAAIMVQPAGSVDQRQGTTALIRGEEKGPT